MACQTPIRCAGKSAFVTAQATSPDYAQEPIEEDDDDEGSNIGETPLDSGKVYIRNVDHLPYSTSSHAHNELPWLTKSRAAYTID